MTRALLFFAFGMMLLATSPGWARQSGDDNFSPYNGGGEGKQCLENSDCSGASNLVCGDAEDGVSPALYFPFESEAVYANDYATDTFSTTFCDTDTLSGGLCPSYTADHSQARFATGMTLPLSYDANYYEGLMGDKVTQAGTSDQRDGSGAFVFPASCPSIERCLVQTRLDLDQSATGTVTMMAWVKPTNTTYNERRIFATGAKSWHVGAGSYKANVWCVSTGVLTGLGGHTTVCSTTTFTPNTWYHVAAVYDGPANMVSVYIDGILDFTASPLGFTSADVPVQIGGYTGSGYIFQGVMDDVAIYENALTAAEIGVLYAAGAQTCGACDCATGGDLDCSEGNLACDATTSLCHTTCCSDGSVSCAEATSRDDSFCQSGGSCQSDGACALCGDGKAEGGEACDGDDLNDATCTSQGFATGEIKCSAACTFDTSACCATANTYYGDGDSDGWGDPAVAKEASCTQPVGYVRIGARGNDCNDGDASVYPGATEVCNDIDDDCDGLTDELLSGTTYYADADGDGCGTNTTSKYDCAQPEGYVTSDKLGDCADADAAVCKTLTYYTDADGDSYGTKANSLCSATAPSGYATVGGDCNDADATVWVRNTYYGDTDSDGYGTTAEQKCSATPPSADYATVGGDCDNFNPSINPGAAETCNGVDDNCNGTIDEGVKTTYYYDGDKDGYGVGKSLMNKQACSLPFGYTTKIGDCNDACSTCYPGAKERLADFKDNDCDGKVDELF